MRKTAKKLLALILTLAMLASTFAMAMISVNAEAATEGFENTTVVANYGYFLAGYNSSEVSVELAADPADANNQVLAFQALANKPEASLTFGDLADADTYTVSFKYYYQYNSKIENEVELANNGYAGFRFGPNGSDWNNVGRCFWWGKSGSTSQVNAGGVKNPTAPEAVVALPVDEWVNVVITKVNNTTLTLSINGTIHTMVFDVNFAGKTPYLNFKSDTQYQNKLLIDDLQVTETVGGNTTTYDKQTFADSKNGGVVTEDTFEGDFKLEKVNSPAVGFVTDPTGANNKCFQFRDNGDNANRARILLADEKLSAYFSLTGKIYLEAINSGYHGVAFELSNRNNGNCIQIISNRADNYYGQGADKDSNILAEMDAAKNWGVVNVVENGELVPNGKIIDVFCDGEWLNFELVRDGSTVALTVWTGNEKPATPTAVNEYEGLGNNPTLLSMMFNGSNKNSAVYVDDLQLVDETDNIRVGGAQASTAVTDGEYAVRFIGVLNSTVEYDKLGFEVVAHYTEGGQAKTKTFTLDTCEAYTSVLASDGANLGAYEVTAQTLGGEYLIALNITNIPAELGAITFEVKAIAYVGGEVDTVSRVRSYVATPDGDSVTLAKA